MAHHVEMMDVDDLEGFDNKENSFHHSNKLTKTPSTEKGYEELDASELNMKLRYSMTPVASPMSKSFTASSLDNRNIDNDLNNIISTENGNLTKSLDSTIIKGDKDKAPKNLPLQCLPTDQFIDSSLRTLENNCDSQHITVIVNEGEDLDEHLSYPSTSSSMNHTPEATTPTTDIHVHAGGSPIMRGLKNVLNMFRSSQSPIPLADGEKLPECEPEIQLLSSSNDADIDNNSQAVLASTPILKNHVFSKRNSPLKDRVVFNDDLEREIQWKDETTILFSEEKIPIHKLFYQNVKPQTSPEQLADTKEVDQSVEYMDISYNESINNKTATNLQDDSLSSIVVTVESDSEFVDCETTFTKNESQLLNDTEILNGDKSDIDTNEVTSDHEVKINEIVPEQLTEKKSENSGNEHVLQELIQQDKNKINSVDRTFEYVVETTIKETDETSQKDDLINNIDCLHDRYEHEKKNEHNETIFNEEINKNNSKIKNNLTHEPMATTSNQNVPSELQENIKTDIISDEHEFRCDEYNTAKMNINQAQKECIYLDQTQLQDYNVTDKVMSESLNIISGTEITNTLIHDKMYSNSMPEDLEIISTKDQKMKIQSEDKIDKILDTVVKNDCTKDTTDVMPETIQNVQRTEDVEIAPYPVEISRNSIDNKNADVEFPGNATSTHEIDSRNFLIPTSKTIEEDQNSLEEINIITEDTLTLTTEAEKIEKISEQVEKTKLLGVLNLALLNNSIGEVKDIDLHADEDVPDSSILLNNQCEITNATMTNNEKEFLILESELEKTNTNDSVTIKTSLMENDNAIEVDKETINIENELPPVTVHSVTSTETHAEMINNTIIHKTIDNDSFQNSPLKVPFENPEYNNQEQIVPLFVTPASCAVNDSQTAVSERLLQGSEPLVSSEEMKIKNSDIYYTKIISNIDVESDLFNEDSCKNSEHTEENINVTTDTEVKKNDLKETEVPFIIENENHINNDLTAAYNPLLSEKETKDEILDEELFVSGNNSPFVSLTTENKTSNEVEQTFVHNETIEVDTKPLKIVSPPLSPKIVSKGYNFNFDEIDDPFATKAKIRMSPPPGISPNNSLDLHHCNKTTVCYEEPNTFFDKNRKKSQIARNKSTFNNKKNNKQINNREHVKESDNKPVSTDKNILENMTKPEIKEDTFKNDNESTFEATTKFPDIIPQLLENENKCEELVKASMAVCENKISETDIIQSNSSSSEKSTYFSIGTSSNDTIESKSVFNLPEIDDKNFIPFASKSKIELSQAILEDNISNNVNAIIQSNDTKIKQEETFSITFEELNRNDNDISNTSNTTCSSKISDERDVTVREINTEDEDTIEGPFLETDDFNKIDKCDFISEKETVPVQENFENADADELFIDAETFEFLMNQNQTNEVADSGKESLFLKFDPLFARRLTSDGVVAALNQIKKRQSTPKKVIHKPQNKVLPDPLIPTPGPSRRNITFEGDSNESSDNVDDFNNTVTKPTMKVTPAVNPVVISRNKAVTPPNINRRSINFTSPAMAVIDRLLSLSSNNSPAQNTTITHASQEQNEADSALRELRELLSEKEQSVQDLRSETVDLKNRLSHLENQMQTLEAESEERLKKINDLNERLLEKTKINKSMALVVEEYERTIASLISEKEQDKRRHAEERIVLIKERDEQTAHLASMEVSFSDLHSKYEKSKQVILGYKSNEDTYIKSIKDFEENLAKMQNNYELLKLHATSKLNHANQELEKMNRSHESEVLKFNAMIKRKELHITSLEETLAQKTKANEELTAICDELINKVG